MQVIQSFVTNNLLLSLVLEVNNGKRLLYKVLSTVNFLYDCNIKPTMFIFLNKCHFTIPGVAVCINMDRYFNHYSFLLGYNYSHGKSRRMLSHNLTNRTIISVVI